MRVRNVIIVNTLAVQFQVHEFEINIYIVQSLLFFGFLYNNIRRPHNAISIYLYNI